MIVNRMEWQFTNNNQICNYKSKQAEFANINLNFTIINYSYFYNS